MWLIPRRRADMAPGETRRLKSACAGLRMGEPPLVAEFERRVAAFTGVPQAAAVNSGRLGMRLILEYLGVGDGAEVIIPAYTLKDLIPIVRNSGAEAVPADIDPRTLNVTAASVERRITARTRAIIVLHAFGAPAPVDEITELADRRSIPVIEDCAHSLGATLHGRQTGSFGYAGFFSFEPTKPVNTYGGGMVVSRDPDLVRFIRAREAKKPSTPRPSCARPPPRARSGCSCPPASPCPCSWPCPPPRSPALWAAPTAARRACPP